MTFSQRYLITLLSSVVRAGLNFTVSIQVAKYLMPEMYGNYQYLLSVFTSILLFINMGTESAYFTFISQKKQNIRFHIRTESDFDRSEYSDYSKRFMSNLAIFSFSMSQNLAIFPSRCMIPR